MHDFQIRNGKFSIYQNCTNYKKNRPSDYKILKMFQLNEDGTYNKVGTREAMRKYWSEWSLENIDKINNKCYEDGKMIFRFLI